MGVFLLSASLQSAFVFAEGYDSAEKGLAKLAHWKHFVKKNRNKNNWQKMHLVNQYFNQFHYVTDETLWSMNDYWAMPTEFIALGAGDCEDFAIAKFFTLLAMGVEAQNLRLTYMMRTSDQIAHMVLIVFEGGSHQPLVLDNASEHIKLLGERKDLDPVYSFNLEGLWLAQSRDSLNQYVGDAAQIKRWKAISSETLSDFAEI